MPCPPPRDCEDGDLCATAYQVGDAGACTAECRLAIESGYGITDCDDGDSATIDIITSGSPEACNVTCDHLLCSAAPCNPDDMFEDSNCDGLDGTIERMVLVATLGNDNAGNGTMFNPYQTINRGITAAVELGSSTGFVYGVAVSQGTYNERVVLQTGVSVYGGYIVRFPVWGRSAAAARAIMRAIWRSQRFRYS